MQEDTLYLKFITRALSSTRPPPTIHSKTPCASKGKHGSEAITSAVEEVQEEAEIGGRVESRDGTAWARTEARAGLEQVRSDREWTGQTGKHREGKAHTTQEKVSVKGETADIVDSGHSRQRKG